MAHWPSSFFACLWTETKKNTDDEENIRSFYVFLYCIVSIE